MPVAIGGGYVDVSFHPVSSAGGVSFDDSKMPRFVASNDPVMVVEIDDCITTLLFPFVTNKAEFDTGMVISNTSSEAGSCTIDYSGADAPDDLMSGPVKGGEQWIALVSGMRRDSRAISRQPVDFGMRLALPSSLTATGSEAPPRRRAISLYAWIATTKKGHRAAAPRVRK